MLARNFKPLLAALVAAGSLSALCAHAEGFYLGGALGGQNFPSNINGNAISGSDLSGKIYGGYKLNPNYALEAGLTDLGSLNSPNGKVHSYGSYVDAIGLAPVAPQWNLYGSIGAAHMAVDTPTGNGTGDGVKLGVGAEYEVSKSTAIRVGWDRYHLNAFGDGPRGDQLTVGVKIGF